jgi:Cys-rich protein (TIGR04453 family)
VSHAVRLSVALMLALWVLPACEGGVSDECRTPCLRVAKCRKRARVGDNFLGEKDNLRPDEKCMTRCKSKPEDWATCEKQAHSCEELRTCYGPLR